MNRSMRLSGGDTVMKLQMRLPFQPHLIAAITSCTMLAAASTAVSGIENPTCELISPGVYRLDYQASPRVGVVKVFASSRPDRIDSAKPVLTIRKTPAEVSIPGQTGRIYFHLKPALGPTRVVSILITSPSAEYLTRGSAAINGKATDSVRAYEYATKYAGQYAKVLQRLASGDPPAVEHCTAGKDRAGVFSAILLTALGVPREVVIQDYLLSNQYLLAPDTIQNTAADLQRAFGLPELPDIASVRTLMSSK